MTNKSPLVIIMPVFIFLAIMAIYILNDWGSALWVKRYDVRPELSPAPMPYTNNEVNHGESSTICDGDSIFDSYTVNKSVNEVESYYQQEMEKYCLLENGWHVTFHDLRPCYGWEEIGMKEYCRYAACQLKREPPSLYEDFSVSIFNISPTDTYVVQDHGMHYLHTQPSDVQCGE